MLPEHSYANPDPYVAARYRSSAPTPPNSSSIPKRRAVALDCEMAGLSNGMDEVIVLSAVDYLTGEILINTLVRPRERIMDWRTRWSGVTSGHMKHAISRGTALNGWQEARDEMWNFIDEDTVLVGHALKGDLEVLRMIHVRIVDTMILTQTTTGHGGSRMWGLKELSKVFLNKEIQGGGRRGHDCLEDTLATREVALWCTREVEKLADWARVQRVREEEKWVEKMKKLPEMSEKVRKKIEEMKEAE